jgi:hypothetical protein
MRAEVAQKYDLVTIKDGCYDTSGYGLVNTTTMTLGQADQLFAAGFPFLALKPVPAPVAKPAAPAAAPVAPAVPDLPPTKPAAA